jgi:hypothetical protein
MTIERRSGTIVFKCDYCTEVIDTQTNDFGKAVARFMAADWQSGKVGEVWKHACPSHDEDLAQEIRRR